MYVVTPESLKSRFPEFSHQTDARVQFCIETASLAMTNAADWVSPQNFVAAFSFLAAHYLMVDIQREESGTGQQVASERIGSDFSVNYVAPETPDYSDGDMTTTQYGIRYLQLQKMNFPAILTV